MDVDDVIELNGGCRSSSLKERRRRGVHNTCEQFVAQSTLHGLHYIFEKRPAPQRCIWLILQTTMFALFFWQTLTLTLDYLEYNVTSTTEFVTEQESKFPAVTLCNFNKYRKSVINRTDFHEVLLIKNPLYPSKVVVNWTKYANVNDLNMKEFIHKAGHQMEYNQTTKKGMLYRCTWRGDVLNHTAFTPVLTDMGLCYTFNSGKNMTIRKVDSPGSNFGLHLRMSVEQAEYIGNLAFSAGLRIRIHDPDEPPLVSSLGFAVMPGSHVFASITRRRTISLKHPYKTKCKDQKLPGIKAYTVAACHEHCKKKYIAKECKCEAFYMKDTDYDQCNVQQYFDCVVRLEEQFSSTSMRNCKCTEPCDTMKYHAYLSYGAFPSEEAAKEYSNNSEKMKRSFRKNLLAMDIFFEELNYNIIRQVPAYSLQSILGEIGGLMGLFLGASILTVFEFVDVIIIIVLTRLGIYKRKTSSVRV